MSWVVAAMSSDPTIRRDGRQLFWVGFDLFRRAVGDCVCCKASLVSELFLLFILKEIRSNEQSR